MIPLDRLAASLERRFAKRTLARTVVVLVVSLLMTQLLVVWYFGSVGLSLREMAYDADDRTVVIDADDHRKFARYYRSDREEGWCLYGSINETRIRIAEVVHANAISKSSERIQFTCARETAKHVLTGGTGRLIGTVHSHPSKNRSRLSRVDTMTWGRTSPVVEVMGVYTEGDGVEFFTSRSILNPLRKEIREPSPRSPGPSTAPRAQR